MDTQEIVFSEVRHYPLRTFKDDRGFFRELFRADAHGVAFVQDNHSFSEYGVVRGMHFQRSPGQAKLVTVLQGKILDVVVDIRSQSPTFGRWAGFELLAGDQLWVPVGFAHGFCVLSPEGAHVCYKVSAYYDPDEEKTFRYDDPFVGIVWPCVDPILSERDRFAPLLQEVIC